MKVVLNEVQRGAVSWYFDPENDEGEPWPLDEPVEIGVEEGELVLNGTYLHSDGEWGTMAGARSWPMELTPAQREARDVLAERYPSVRVEHCPRRGLLPESVLLTPCDACTCDPQHDRDECPRCEGNLVVPRTTALRVYPGGMTRVVFLPTYSQQHG